MEAHRQAPWLTWSTKALTGRWLLALEVVAIGCLLAAVAAAYLTHSLNMIAFFDSDEVYLPLVAQDLLFDGGPYSAWNFPQAPFFFPDWPLYFPYYAIVRDAYAAQILFALTQLGLAYLLVRAIYGEVLEGNKRVLASVASFGAFVAVTLGSKDPRHDAFATSLLTGFHWGELLASLLSLWLVLRIIKDSRFRVAFVVLLCAVEFLTGLSDAIHLIHYTVPVVLTVGYLCLRRELPRIDFLHVAALPGLAALIGWRLKSLAEPRDHPIGLRYGLDGLSNRLPIIQNVVEEVARSDLLVPVLFIVFYACASIFAVRHLLKRQSTPVAPNFLVTYLLVSAPVWICVALLAQTRNNATRYWAPFFSMPLFFFAVPLALLKPGVLRVTAGVVLVWALASVANQAIDNGTNLQRTYYPADVRCVDQALAGKDLTYGIGQYWASNHISVLSQRGLQVLTVASNLRPVNHVNSADWFRPAYDFALIDYTGGVIVQLDTDRLTALNGQPSFMTRCGPVVIWGYGPNGLKTGR